MMMKKNFCEEIGGEEDGPHTTTGGKRKRDIRE